MTTSGFDSYGAVPASALDGFDFIGRYVSAQAGKCIVASEVATYRAAKKSIILVYEDDADDALGGANAGAAKAMIARPILSSIGWPTSLPVHFAVDMPGYAQDLSAFVACAKAFAEGIGRPAGIYGDVDTCTAAHQAAIEFIWQFGENVAPGRTVYQGSPPITVEGIDVDPDTALVANYGQWSPTPEEIMDLHTVTFPAAGANGEASHQSSYAFDKVASLVAWQGLGPNHIVPGKEPGTGGNALLVVKGAAPGQVVKVDVGVLA